MTDPNLISIRECARRLGVSDTAVHKARKEGDSGKSAVRVFMHEDGKRVMWAETSAAWLARSDVTRRSHVGPQGSPRRAGEKPMVHLTTSDRMDEGPGTMATGGAPASLASSSARAPAAPQPDPDDDDDGDGPKSGRGGRYTRARAEKEEYQAKLAKLEFEQKSGKLVDGEAAQLAWFKLIKAAQTKILGIPAACKSRVSDLPLKVVAEIDKVCREALEDLAKQKGLADDA